jgi:hypothetical protein
MFIVFTDPRPETLGESPLQLLVRLGFICSSSESLSNTIRAILHYFLLAYGNYFSGETASNLKFENVGLDKFYSFPYDSFACAENMNRLEKPILSFSGNRPPLPQQCRLESCVLGILEVLPESLLLRKTVETLEYCNRVTDLFKKYEYRDLDKLPDYARTAVNSLFRNSSVRAEESRGGSFQYMFRKRKSVGYSSLIPLGKLLECSGNDVFDLLQLCSYCIYSNVEVLNSLALMVFVFCLMPPDRFLAFVNSERTISFNEQKVYSIYHFV